ncbi:hypothetical protein V1517DRAFT_191853 [Lipomyces orientalis]|uniref:Uncharacterized protein n=1 Tax=Lipomyces orientalis TaxID=1233043 RepID=A0ACC3TXK4_9ASCO
MLLRGLFSRRHSRESISELSDDSDSSGPRAPSPPILASRSSSARSGYLNTGSLLPCPAGFEAVHIRPGPDCEYGCVTEWPTFKDYDKETSRRIVRSLQNLDLVKFNACLSDRSRLATPSLKQFRRQINYLRVYLVEGANFPSVGRHLDVVKHSAEQHPPPAFHTFGHVNYLLDRVPHRVDGREFATSVADRAYERQGTWDYAATSTRVHAICSKDERSLHCGTLHARIAAWDPHVVLIRATKLSHAWLNTLARARFLGTKIVVLVDCSSSQYDGIVRTICLFIHDWNTAHRVHVNRIMEPAAVYDQYERAAASGAATSAAWAFHPLVVSLFRVDDTVSATFTGVHEYLSLFSYVKHWFAPAVTCPARLDCVSIRPPRRIGGNIRTVFWTDDESPIFRITAARFDARTGRHNIHVVGHKGELVLGTVCTLGPDGYDVRGRPIYYDIVVHKIVHVPSYANRRVVKEGETAAVTITVRRQPPDFHINETNMRRMRITRDLFAVMTHSLPDGGHSPHRSRWRLPRNGPVRNQLADTTAARYCRRKRYTRPPTGVVVLAVDALSHADRLAKWNFRRDTVINVGLAHGWLYARVLDRHPARNLIVVEFVNKPAFLPPGATFQDLVPHAKSATPAWDVVWTCERVAIVEMHDTAGELCFAGRIVGVEFVDREIPGFPEFLQQELTKTDVVVLDKVVESSDENGEVLA